jgi:FemAB-related protein (PEP-CTERM system-associated)
MIAAAATRVSADLLQVGEEGRWNAFAESHPDGTIYHSLAWRSVTQEGLGHRPYYLRSADSSGEFHAILPLFLVKGPFGRRLVSVPMRDRGGLLANDRESASLLLRRAIALTRELECRYLELRSLNDLDAQISREYGLVTERGWITTRIDLSQGTDRLWSALDRDAVRWAITKVRRQGVTFELDNSGRAIDLFFELFARTRTSMGIPPFPKRLFTAIWEHVIERGHGNLAVVRSGSQPINAMISLFSGGCFVPAYAAPQNEWRKSYPSEVIFWGTIEWAARQGFRCYDFGADSARQTGLLWFKRKWGGVPHAMSYNYFLNGGAAPVLDSSSPTYSLARAAWRHLPLTASKLLGSWITRQLS